MYNGWLPDAALGIEGNSKECWEMAMSGLTKLTKLIAAFAAVISIMFAATTPSQAQTGTVRINVVKAGFIVGAGGGSGTLTFRGHTYPLSIGGLSLGTRASPAPVLSAPRRICTVLRTSPAPMVRPAPALHSSAADR